MWSIRQNGTQWEVVRDGTVLSSHGTYDAALGVIGAELAAVLATDGEGATTSTGVLAERWTTTTGIAFQEQPDSERDFTQCQWSFRDPAVYPLPVMLQTETEMGHFGAQLAGFMDTVMVGDTPMASGGYWDCDAGRQLRDMLESGMRFGVSVDPTDVEVEYVCTEQDDDGFCMAGLYRFLSYEIGGMTATPFPAFANATMEKDTGQAASDPAAVAGDAVVASAGAAFATLATRVATPTVDELVEIVGSHMAAPIEPPRAWFFEPEPQVGDPRLVEQDDGSLACPLTITPDGQVYGHLARWGQCHVANPQGPSMCVTPPEDDDAGYSSFRVASVLCEDGTEVPTGPLIAGCDHPSTMLSAAEARDAYAHNGTGWADVAASAGVFGPWVCGALRPELTPLQVRVLRASALSGDWRETVERPGVLSLIAGLATNVPGFPVARAALTASAGLTLTTAAPRARQHDGRVVALTASGIVSPCPECAARNAAAVVASASGSDLEVVLAELATLRSTLAKVERRTRHLNGNAATALAARIRT